MERLLGRTTPSSFPIYLAITMFIISVSQQRSDCFLQAQTRNPPTITLTVSVTGKKDQPVKDLPQSSFSITMDKTPQEIVSFTSQDAPASVGIVFDLSGSMGENGHISKSSQSALEGLEHFLRLGHQSNEYFILGVNQQPHVLLEGGSDPNAAKEVLNKIPSLSFSGSAPILDAFLLALDKLSRGTYPKQVIILVTDGIADLSSRTSFKATIRSLKEKNTLVYPILILPGDYSEIGSAGADEFQSMLKDYASLSGGFLSKTRKATDFRTFTERIATELHNQYVIEIRLKNPIVKDKCFSPKIKVVPVDDSDKFKSLSVRSREFLCL